jgi:hypothetical protein
VDACISGHIEVEHVITCTFGCRNGEMHVESFSDVDGTVVWHIEVLQQRLKDIGAQGRGVKSFVLNEHSFLSFAELQDWIQKKSIPSCGAYWDLFSIMVTMSPEQMPIKEWAL